jgi:hypothetical protein
MAAGFELAGYSAQSLGIVLPGDPGRFVSTGCAMWEREWGRCWRRGCKLWRRGRSFPALLASLSNALQSECRGDDAMQKLPKKSRRRRQNIFWFASRQRGKCALRVFTALGRLVDFFGIEVE